MAHIHLVCFFACCVSFCMIGDALANYQYEAPQHAYQAYVPTVKKSLTKTNVESTTVIRDTTSEQTAPTPEPVTAIDIQETKKLDLIPVGYQSFNRLVGTQLTGLAEQVHPEVTVVEPPPPLGQEVTSVDDAEYVTDVVTHLPNDYSEQTKSNQNKQSIREPDLETATEVIAADEGIFEEYEDHASPAPSIAIPSSPAPPGNIFPSMINYKSVKQIDESTYIGNPLKPKERNPGLVYGFPPSPRTRKSTSTSTTASLSSTSSRSVSSSSNSPAAPTPCLISSSASSSSSKVPCTASTLGGTTMSLISAPESTPCLTTVRGSTGKPPCNESTTTKAMNEPTPATTLSKPTPFSGSNTLTPTPDASTTPGASTPCSKSSTPALITEPLKSTTKSGKRSDEAPCTKTTSTTQPTSPPSEPSYSAQPESTSSPYLTRATPCPHSQKLLMQRADDSVPKRFKSSVLINEKNDNDLSMKKVMKKNDLDKVFGSSANAEKYGKNNKGVGAVICEDRLDKCVEWTENGECELNPFWMKPNCQKSCQSCGMSISEIDKPAPKNNCDNKHELCQFWKQGGECESNMPYMKVNCPLSCEFC